MLYLVTAFSAMGMHSRALVPLLFVLGAAGLIAGIAAPATPFPAAAGPLRSLGLLVVLGCSYLLSFKDAFGLLRQVDLTKPGIGIYLGAACAALVGAIVLLARARRVGLGTYRYWELTLLGVGLVIVLASGLFGFSRSVGWPVLLAFNVIVLGFAALFILEGSEQLRAKMVGAGCLLFAMVVFGRYADLFTSLLVRAAVFIALGAALFFVGNFYARSRRRVQGAQS